jgi:hypothetical protein
MEDKRCYDVPGPEWERYTAIVPAGAFGHAMISQVLARADQAAVRSDLPAMIVSFREMKECQ